MLFAYPHESTEIIPFKLLYRREPTLPTTLFLPEEQLSLTVGIYLEENIAEAWATAQTNISGTLGGGCLRPGSHLF